MMLGKGKGGKGRSATRAAATAEDVSSVQVSLDAGSTTGVGSGIGGAGGARSGRVAPVAGGSSETGSVALHPHLASDPDAFECPFSACDYDCQLRAPVRVPCTCKRLVCRKCADVAGTLPSGCGLCGAAGVSFRSSDSQRDVGALLALAATVAPAEYVLTDSCIFCSKLL